MGKEFSVDIGPVPEGDICDVTLTQGPHQIVLTNVLFGDVWICSGNVTRLDSSKGLLCLDLPLVILT